MTEPASFLEVGPSSVAAPRTRRVSIWALPAMVLVTIAVVLFVLAPRGTSIDYTVFEKAGSRFLGGEDLYRSTEFFSFKYAPVAAAFFAPFSLLPHRFGWFALNLLSIVALLWVVRWAFRRFEERPGFFEMALVLAMTAPYYGHLIWLGQMDGLILALLVASEAQAERRPIWSGALWALACLVKPPFLVLLLAVLIRRQWRRLLGLAAGVPLWLAVGAARYGVPGGAEQVRAWSATLTHSTPELICWEFNQSLFAIVCTYVAPLGTPRFAVALGLVAALAFAAGLAAVAAIWRGSATHGRLALFGFALYLGAFLSPLGWNTNLLAALPLAVALAWVAASGTQRSLRLAASCAALLITLLNCVDLFLLPFGFWDDTARVLFYYRQYGIAGIVLAGTSLGFVALHFSMSAREGQHVLR